MQQKPVSNSRWSVRWGWLRHALSKSALSSPGIQSGAGIQGAAVCTDILQLGFKVYTKGGSKVALYYGVLYCGPILQVNGSVVQISGGRLSCLAGSCLSRRLCCTKSSVHKILVIKTRWSMTNEIIISSFHWLVHNPKLHVLIYIQYGSTDMMNYIHILPVVNVHVYLEYSKHVVGCEQFHESVCSTCDGKNSTFNLWLCEGGNASNSIVSI